MGSWHSIHTKFHKKKGLNDSNMHMDSTQTHTENMWMSYTYFLFLIRSKSTTINCLKCEIN